MARILVIEDDVQVREMLRQGLERHGHDVQEAPDGDAGMRVFREGPVDLVITDILMPNKDGVETIRELRRDFPKARVIAITGVRGRFNRLPAARYLGATRTLLKPFTMDEFLQVVKEVLAEA